METLDSIANHILNCSSPDPSLREESLAVLHNMRNQPGIVHTLFHVIAAAVSRPDTAQLSAIAQGAASLLLWIAEHRIPDRSYVKAPAPAPNDLAPAEAAEIANSIIPALLATSGPTRRVLTALAKRFIGCTWPHYGPAADTISGLLSGTADQLAVGAALAHHVWTIFTPLFNRQSDAAARLAETVRGLGVHALHAFVRVAGEVGTAVVAGQTPTEEQMYVLEKLAKTFASIVETMEIWFFTEPEGLQHMQPAIIIACNLVQLVCNKPLFDKISTSIVRAVSMLFNRIDYGLRLNSRNTANNSNLTYRLRVQTAFARYIDTETAAPLRAAMPALVATIFDRTIHAVRAGAVVRSAKGVEAEGPAIAAGCVSTECTPYNEVILHAILTMATSATYTIEHIPECHALRDYRAHIVTLLLPAFSASHLADIDSMCCGDHTTLCACEFESRPASSSMSLARAAVATLQSINSLRINERGNIIAGYIRELGRCLCGSLAEVKENVHPYQVLMAGGYVNAIQRVLTSYASVPHPKLALTDHVQEIVNQTSRLLAYLPTEFPTTPTHVQALLVVLLGRLINLLSCWAGGISYYTDEQLNDTCAINNIDVNRYIDLREQLAMQLIPMNITLIVNPAQALYLRCSAISALRQILELYRQDTWKCISEACTLQDLLGPLVSLASRFNDLYKTLTVLLEIFPDECWQLSLDLYTVLFNDVRAKYFEAWTNFARNDHSAAYQCIGHATEIFHSLEAVAVSSAGTPAMPVMFEQLNDSVDELKLIAKGAHPRLDDVVATMQPEDVVSVTNEDFEFHQNVARSAMQLLNFNYADHEVSFTADLVVKAVDIIARLLDGAPTNDVIESICCLAAPLRHLFRHQSEVIPTVCGQITHIMQQAVEPQVQTPTGITACSQLVFLLLVDESTRDFGFTFRNAIHHYQLIASTMCDEYECSCGIWAHASALLMALFAPVYDQNVVQNYWDQFVEEISASLLPHDQTAPQVVWPFLEVARAGNFSSTNDLQTILSFYVGCQVGGCDRILQDACEIVPDCEPLVEELAQRYDLRLEPVEENY